MAHRDTGGEVFGDCSSGGVGMEHREQLLLKIKTSPAHPNHCVRVRPEPADPLHLAAATTTWALCLLRGRKPSRGPVQARLLAPRAAAEAESTPCSAAPGKHPAARANGCPRGHLPAVCHTGPCAPWVALGAGLWGEQVSGCCARAGQLHFHAVFLFGPPHWAFHHLLA